MGLSYRKSTKIGPLRITASKSGISYSAGVKGARITKRADGRVQNTLSVPGTGVRYTTTKPRTGKTAGRRTGRASRPRRTQRRYLAIAQLRCRIRRPSAHVRWPSKATLPGSRCFRTASRSTGRS